MTVFTTPSLIPLRRGFALPATKTEKSGYFATRQSFDLAIGDLMLLLFTPIGSRPMRRSWGSPVFDLIYNVPVTATDGELRFYIEDAVSKHLPRVQLHRINIQRNGQQGTILFQIEFGLLNLQARDTLKVSVDTESALRRIGGTLT